MTHDHDKIKYTLLSLPFSGQSRIVDVYRVPIVSLRSSHLDDFTESIGIADYNDVGVTQLYC